MVKEPQKPLRHQHLESITRASAHLPEGGSVWLNGHRQGTLRLSKILYENYPYLLTDEISNRKGLNKLFDESEIWYLLYTAVSAANDFEKIARKLGDIRP